MKSAAATVVSMLLGVALCGPLAGVAAQQAGHYGAIIADDGNPVNCIICHDGQIASPAHFCTVECGFTAPHSILKDYPPRSLQDAYAPLEALKERGIRLFNGKVSCVSCHDLNRDDTYHLIMDNSRSALCLTCHIT